MKTKTILLCIFCSYLFLCGCGSKENVFAPDHIYHSGKENMLFVSNRSGNELVLLKPDLHTIEQKISFDSPVNGLVQVDDRIWVICEGSNGKLYELDAKDLSIISQTEMGASPSAIIYNPQRKSLWVTQRFNNALWEIDTSSKKVISMLNVGREPVDVISFASDNLLLVANNMPEMSALDFPVAAQLSIVDCSTKQVVKRLMLPNGSTDVKAIAVSSDQAYAYVTHLLARYQLPTTQVDRGWMSTNALSIIDLQKKEIVTTVLLDTPQKGSANPWGITVSPDDKYIIVAASGVHELISIDRKALHERLDKVRDGIMVTPSTHKWEDIPNDAGFLYGIHLRIPTEGKGPRTVIATDKNIYTANYFTGEIVKISFDATEKTIGSLGKDALVSTKEGKGNMYFHDATIGFQGWQSCATCHPNDARADSLNWDLLNDGMGNPKNTKTLVLSHKTPPCMISGIRKNAEVAVRAGLKYILFAQENEEIGIAMDAYLKSLTPVPSPYLVNGELSEAAKRGKISYDNDCASCHPAPYYTDQKQYLVSWAHGSEKNVMMDVPALNEIWRTAPYLYDGRSATMREMLDVHGPKKTLSDEELADMTEYILSL